MKTRLTTYRRQTYIQMRQGTTGHERGLTKSGEGLRIRTMDN